MLAVLFNCVAGLTLFLFAVHYVYYILNALTSTKPAAANQEQKHSAEEHPPQQHSMQQTEDAKFIKKRLKTGSIEPHPTEKAIILNYQLEAAVFANPGDPMLEEIKSCQRIIRLRTLSAKTDTRALAREVVDKCDIIHRSQLAEVEQIIYYLKNRREHDNCDSMSFAAARPKSRSTSKVNTSGRHASGTTTPAAVAVVAATAAPSPNHAAKEKPSIRHLEEYVELLYEDLPERIRGSDLILRLARYADNLEELEKNEAMLSALARVLREDWRKSLELSTNIIYIFFCFSSYTQFHPVIVQYRIGSLCMDIIDYELKRYESMKADLETRRNPDSNKLTARDIAAAAAVAAAAASAAAAATSPTSASRSSDYLDAIANEERPKEMEPPRRRIPELKQRPKSGNWSSQSSLMSSSLRSLNSSYHENLAGAAAAVGLDNQSPSPSSAGNLSNGSGGGGGGGGGDGDNNHSASPQKTKEDYERLNKQFKVFTMKQEQLLRVAIYLLLNIAENTKFEEKMRKKNIVRILCKALERDNVEVLILVVTFMKKLSIVRDNKNDMHDMCVVDRLPRLLQINNADLVQVTLRFVFNLSFDGALRGRMIRLGLLAKLVTFMSADQHHDIVVRILYHMSLDDKVKSMFTYTECIPMATDMLILSLNQKADRDLAALCINLALNKRNAQLMTENRRLPTLMGKAFRYQDTLLMKILRNVSTHEGLRAQFVDFVGDLARALTECGDEAFVLECVGILGNLSLPDLDYSMILRDFNLIPWIRNVLVPRKTADDLVLDTVVLLGTCACDEACAMLLCKAEVILSLIELLKAKQEDDEMVLQIVFVFQQILCHESTRDYMIGETESPAYLIDLMHDKNPEIRKVCDFCLDVIAVADGEWASRIKLEKFRSHNAQWMNMVETQQQLDDSQEYYNSLEDGDEEYGNELPAYLTSASFLDECMMYQSGEEMAGSGGGGSGGGGGVGRPMSSRGGELELESSSSSKSSRHSVATATSTDVRAMEVDVE